MARKMRTKGKDDDKGGGIKPVKVVTFESPKKGSHQLLMNTSRSFRTDP